MFTDIVGFTSFMEQNEAEALQMISTLRSILNPLLKKHCGSLIKEMGDGTLSTFARPRSAIRCAGELQNKLTGKQFGLRVGIHWGNVLVQPGDVLGDTVNVASRLENLAPPGGVCISGELLDNCGAGRKPDIHNLGLRKLKGLGRLVNLYNLKGSSRHPLPIASAEIADSDSFVALKEEVPSVAIIPLENLGAVGDDFYAYGITSDLVSSLASAGGIVVTPLSDVVKLQQVVNAETDIARRLNVRFVVRGSLWRNEGIFQLSVELHDMQRKRLVWTDSWTDNWFELPSIKGKLADTLLKVLGVDSALTVSTTEDNPGLSQAYSLFLQANDLYDNRHDVKDTEKTRELLEQALEQDPSLIQARFLLGSTYSHSGDLGRAEAELTRVYETARDNCDRQWHLNALSALGSVKWKQSDYKSAKSAFHRSLMLAGTLNDLSMKAKALSNLGLIDCAMGKYDSALEYMEKTLDVPGVHSMGYLKANTLCNIGLTHWSMGDNTGALEYYTSSLNLFDRLGDPGGQANMHMNLGIVTRNMGRFQLSLEHTAKALELNIRIGNKQGQCRTLVGAGNIHNYIGQFEKARKQYNNALEIALDIGDRFTESIVKTNLGNILTEEKQYSEAMPLYQEALSISREIEDIEGVGEVCALIGNTLMKCGSTEEAKNYLQKAVSSLDEIGAESRTTIARLHLAAAFLKTGTARENITEALEQASEVEGLVAPGMNDRVETLFALSGLYGKLAEIPSAGDPKKFHRKRKTHLRDSFTSLMQEADNIHDSELRKCFLNKDLHRRVLTDYKLLQES